MDKYNNYLEYALGAGEQSKQKVIQFRKNYSSFLPKDKNANILDIGPGKGELLSYLASKNYVNIEAVDISKSVVDYIQKLNFKCTLTADLVEFLGDKKGRYSVITMCDVVEHIPKDKILLIVSSIYNSLEEGGILIIQVPNMQSIVANIFMYDDFTHEAGYTERSLTQMLKMCGFSSIHCYGFEFLGNGVKAKIHRFSRSIFWFFIKIYRNINGTMPHKILHPVFFSIAKKC